MTLAGFARYDEALSIWSRRPQKGVTSLFTLYFLVQAGQLSEAQAKLPEILKESPEDAGAMLSLAQAALFAAGGKERQAEEQTQKAAQKKSYGHFHHTALGIAGVYARMHKPEKALDWLERAPDGYPSYPAFARDHNLDPLRKDPRFIAFLERVKQESDHYRALIPAVE